MDHYQRARESDRTSEANISRAKTTAGVFKRGAISWSTRHCRSSLICNRIHTTWLDGGTSNLDVMTDCRWKDSVPVWADCCSASEDENQSRSMFNDLNNWPLDSVAVLKHVCYLQLESEQLTSRVTVRNRCKTIIVCKPEEESFDLTLHPASARSCSSAEVNLTLMKFSLLQRSLQSSSSIHISAKFRDFCSVFSTYYSFN